MILWQMFQRHLVEPTEQESAPDFVPQSVQILEETLEKLEAERSSLNAECTRLQEALRERRTLDTRALLHQEEEFCSLEEELQRLRAGLKESRTVYAKLIEEQQHASEAAQKRLLNSELAAENEWLQTHVVELQNSCEAVLQQNAEVAQSYAAQVEDLEKSSEAEKGAILQKISMVKEEIHVQEAANAAEEQELANIRKENEDLEAEIAAKRLEADKLREMLSASENAGLEAKNAAAEELLRQKQQKLIFYRQITGNDRLASEILQQLKGITALEAAEITPLRGDNSFACSQETAVKSALQCILAAIVETQKRKGETAKASNAAMWREELLRSAYEERRAEHESATQEVEAEIAKMGELASVESALETTFLCSEQQLARLDAGELRAEAEAEAARNMALSEEISAARARITAKNQ